MTYPFFSVIVPTYNRQQAVVRVIGCLQSQDYPADRFEIIIVDDGSTDKTQAMLQRWTASGKICLVKQEKLGPGAARNRGAQMAQGEVLAFTDSDCLPEPDWLSALAEEYTSQGGTTAVGGPIENLTSGSWLQKFQARRGSDHIANHHPSPLYLDTANASFLKTAFLAVGGFNAAYSWSEDVDLGFRMRCAGCQLKTTPRAVVWHAGTNSCRAYLTRSYCIGYAKGRLASDYPEVFYPLPPPGARLAIRNRLEQLIRHQSHFPPQRIPFTFARLLYSLVQLLTWEKVFWIDTIPNQLRHYRSQRIKGWVIGVYLLLEWGCHLAHLVGLVTYNLKASFRQGSIKTS